MVLLCLSLLLLFSVIIFSSAIHQLMKTVDKNVKLVSELRLEIFSLTCDKIRLESTNEILEKRINILESK